MRLSGRVCDICHGFECASCADRPPRREYKSGQRWALWRWTDVTWRGKLYLRRLHLIGTPFGAVMIHWITGPDPAPHPHDHPVSFVSVILRGWYGERIWKRGRGLRWHGEAADPVWSAVGAETRLARVRFTHARDVHEIGWCGAEGVVTLVFAGPKRREWGYHVLEGFVGWREYREARAYDQNVDTCAEVPTISVHDQIIEALIDSLARGAVPIEDLMHGVAHAGDWPLEQVSTELWGLIHRRTVVAGESFQLELAARSGVTISA